MEKTLLKKLALATAAVSGLLASTSAFAANNATLNIAADFDSIVIDITAGTNWSLGTGLILHPVRAAATTVLYDIDASAAGAGTAAVADTATDCAAGGAILACPTAGSALGTYNVALTYQVSGAAALFALNYNITPTMTPFSTGPATGNATDVTMVSFNANSQFGAAANSVQIIDNAGAADAAATTASGGGAFATDATTGTDVITVGGGLEFATAAVPGSYTGASITLTVALE